MSDINEALLTSTTGAVQTVSSSDVTIASISNFAVGNARRIYPCSSGNLAIKRANDTAFVVYPVFAGQYIDGKIVAVGGTGSGSTSGLTWIPER